MGDISKLVHDSETSSRDIRAVCKSQALPRCSPLLPGCFECPRLAEVTAGGAASAGAEDAHPCPMGVGGRINASHQMAGVY